jgi:hypothetical protein
MKNTTNTRRAMQELKIRISQAKDSPRTPEENWGDVGRWMANTDEDHLEGVQGLLLLILERHGTCLLNLAAETESKSARFSIALALQERHFPRVKVSRILAALRSASASSASPSERSPSQHPAGGPGARRTCSAVAHRRRL